jgi:hypothetical protein
MSVATLLSLVGSGDIGVSPLSTGANFAYISEQYHHVAGYLPLSAVAAVSTAAAVSTVAAVSAVAAVLTIVWLTRRIMVCALALARKPFAAFTLVSPARVEPFSLPKSSLLLKISLVQISYKYLLVPPSDHLIRPFLIVLKHLE